MANTVFISHKNTDSLLAARVAKRIERNGLGTYLDVIDDALVKDGPDLADLLLERMSKCDQLIAVVSASTRDSWWVPWEIGVGSEKGFRMATYSEVLVSLPSYLEKWPDLHTDGDIDLYCSQSAKTDADIRRQFTYILNESARIDVRKRGAQDFHKLLRTSLRNQRR